MFRFIIAFGTQGTPEERGLLAQIRLRLFGSTDNWRDVIAEPNFLSTYAVSPLPDGATPTLHGGRGVIFGSLYPSETTLGRQGPALVRALSEQQSATIVRSRGRSLISDFWGHYVAVIRYPETASVVLVRGPVSPLPCLRLRVGTVNVFFSHVGDCMTLGLRALSINWDSITAQVVGGDYLTDETGINEILSLECGQAISCAPSGDTIHVYWHPSTFLADRKGQRFAEAVRRVRQTTERCTHALASSHDSVLVNLSGGLDSSIILGALARSPHRPQIVAINYFSTGCGDERRFARSMAQAANCPLIEQARQVQFDLQRFDDCNFTVQPVLNFSAPDIEARNIAQARELQASAIFNGELGDNLFGNNPTAGALVECVAQHGLGRVLFRAITDFSMLTRQSLWRTLSLLRHEYQYISAHPNFSVSEEMRRRHGIDKARSMLLASSAAEEHFSGMTDRFLHSWLRGSRRLAPGSHMLVYGLMVVNSTAYHSPFSGANDPAQISPLISQPLVEVALQTPSTLHFERGQDRAVARTAFSDVLPATILHRGLGKGGPSLWAKETVEHNATFLRDFLLDGILVKRNLIDRAKVESALSPKIEKSTAIVGDIFAKLYIEAWLRKATSSVCPVPLGCRS